MSAFCCRLVRLSLCVLVAFGSLACGRRCVAAPPIAKLPPYKVALPSEGDVALVHMSHVVKPASGRAIPKGAGVHVSTRTC